MAQRPESLVLYAAAALLASSVTVAWAQAPKAAGPKIYCWKNAKGQTECGDQPPANAPGDVRELSKRGITVETKPPPPTAEQKKAQEAEAARKKAEQERLAQQKLADKIMLDTYNSVDEIELQRKREVGLIESRIKLAGYFRHLVAERRRAPRGDLLSLLIAAEEQGDKLTEPELLSTCILLYVAGHETTVNLIGNGLLALLRHPDQLGRLREDPGPAASAVEELLRYDGPVQRTARITATEVEIGGRTIEKGAMVVVVLGEANRDPAHFPDPDRLDVGRADNRHIAFGFGIHFCLGAPLARLEGQIALGTIARRLPGFSLATAEPQWRESQVLRGLTALPVTF